MNNEIIVKENTIRIIRVEKVDRFNKCNRNYFKKSDWKN